MTITSDLNDQNVLDITGRVGYLRLSEGASPTHPGEMLLEEFLNPLGISQQQLANAIHISEGQVKEIVEERSRLTPTVALRLARYIGPSVGFWMNCQLAWDLYHALKADEDILNAIEPLHRLDLPELKKLAGLEEKDC